MEHSLTLSFSICVIEDSIYSFSYSLRATKVLAPFVHIVITNTAENEYLQNVMNYNSKDIRY